MVSEYTAACTGSIFRNAHQKTIPLLFFFTLGWGSLGARSNKHISGAYMNNQSKNRAFSIQNAVIFQDNHGANFQELKMSPARHAKFCIAKRHGEKLLTITKTREIDRWKESKKCLASSIDPAAAVGRTGPLRQKQRSAECLADRSAAQAGCTVPPVSCKQTLWPCLKSLWTTCGICWQTQDKSEKLE